MTVHDPRTVPAPSCRLSVRRTATADLYAPAETVKRIAGARLFWLGGPLAESTTRAGVHAVTMQALIRSPAPGRREPLAEKLESIGVTVTAGVTASCCYVDLRGPREQLAEALRWTAPALAYGKIDELAFRAAQNTTIHQVEQRAHDRKLLAADAFRAAWAGPESSFARPPEGTYVSLHALRLRDVEAMAQVITRGRLNLVIAGDPAWDGYLDQVAELTAKASGEGPAPPVAPELGRTPPPQLQVGAGEGGPAYLLWGTLTPIDGAADHVVAETAAHILGGWSGSQWQSLLREELGYTYGTNASTASLRLGERTYATMQVGMSVAADVVGKTQDLLTQQAADFVSHGPDPQLHRAASVRLLRSEAHFHDATRNLMARTASFLQAGLGAEFAEQRMVALRETSPERFAERLQHLLRHTTVVTLGRPDAP